MKGLFRRAVGSLMALLMALNTACYSFVAPASGVAPAVGTQVRLRLNASGTAELAQFLGPRVEYAEGTLSEVRSDGSVVVGVTSVRVLDGVENSWSGQNVVTIAPSQRVEVHVRTLDKHRTRVATVASIASVIAVFALALVGGVAHGDTPGSGTPPPP